MDWQLEFEMPSKHMEVDGKREEWVVEVTRFDQSWGSRHHAPAQTGTATMTN